MIRLRDESALDPVSERGIEILRQVEPPPRPPEMKWRVWAALQQTPDGASVGLRPGRFKALVLGAGILAFAATAVGAAGGRWIAQRVQRLRAPQAGPAAAAQQQHPRAVRRLALAAPPVVEPSPALVAPPLEAHAPAREPEPMRVHHVAPSPARERTQVLDALIALRRDHDAARASVLLDHYLETNRRGALREEALVLAIEAADARADAAHALRLARTYVSEYPRGRFDTFVRSHIKE